MSPHHFTKNTVEASAWCLKCNRQTLHAIADGRIGACLVYLERLEAEHVKPKEAKVEQGNFEFDAGERQPAK